MLVLTSVKHKSYLVGPGDTFELTVAQTIEGRIKVSETVIKEYIRVAGEINFIATARYADEDGICRSFNLVGIFANDTNLPDEVKKAIKYCDLSKDQKKKFCKSLGFKTMDYTEE